MNTTKPTTTFWLIAVLALIWNLMGVFAYLGQAFLTEEAIALMPENEQELLKNIPAWATAAFAVAVWGGLLGSILLLLRKKWAYTVFIISFMGIIVQMVYNLFMSKSIEVYGPGGYIMPVLVIIFGLLLIWYSKQCIAKGLLK